MNKIKRTVVAFLSVLLVASLLSGCSDSSSGDSKKKKADMDYKAKAGFYYSGDKGHTYGDGTKEYEVGETVYMKVKFKVTSDKKKIKQIGVVLTIPNIDSVDAKYMDGQVITPEYDPEKNVTTYEFTANASKEPEEQECVIQFVPNSTGSVAMTLVFDDTVDDSYDIQSTLEFVEPEEDEPEED